MPKKAVLLELDEAQHADWKSRAKVADLTLSAWIRMKCSEETVLFVGPENPAAIKFEAAIRKANGTELKHTATSNRMTCQCPSCRDYRERNDIPLGGLKRG